MQPVAGAIDHVFTNVGEVAHDGARQLLCHESIDATANYQYWARVVTCGGRVFHSVVPDVGVACDHFRYRPGSGCHQPIKLRGRQLR